jgi:AraC-like DNA-binding protein
MPSREGTARRYALLDTPVALVEDLRQTGTLREKTPEGFCDVFQVCFPYRGLFVWHVGRDAVVGDANQIVFVKASESYQMSNPVGGYAELIVTPDQDMLAEIAHAGGYSLACHPLFLRRCRPASPALQLFRERFHHRTAGLLSDADTLEAEERVITLVRASVADASASIPSNPRTRRLVRYAKEFLEARLATPVRLADVGRAVGASPAYLTDVFRRLEGMPLHRYLTRLRLARALVELRRQEDLTTVALATGFCSHSHFTWAFRRTFGCTPSEYRRTLS